VVALSVLLLAITVSSAQATVIVEDFSTACPTAPYLGDTGGGSGWNGAWGASSTGAWTGNAQRDDSANLSSSLYYITQEGTGLGYVLPYPDWRGINRYTTPLSGTVWFSYLQQNWSGTPGYSALQLNAHAGPPYDGSDYTRGNFEVGLKGDQLAVRFGGVDTYGTAGALATGATHLIVGKLTIGAGNDSLEVWADPADVHNLGTAQISAGDADLGDALTLVGFGGNDTYGLSKFDALRLSDGPNGSIDVVGVPEPSTMAMVITGLIGLVCYAWRKQK
jgi:hypothetical protein